MATDTGFADVNGARLYYEVAGSGEPVVLLHGFAIDCRMWDGQWDEFAKRHQVIRYDMRGFGKSDTPNGQSYSHAGDLKAVLDHLGVSGASIVGLSMGGEAAVTFGITYPEETTALVLVDSSLTGVAMDEETAAEFGAAWAAASESGVDAAKKVWLDLSVFDATMDKPAVATQLRQLVADYSGWHWLNEDPAIAPEPPMIERLSEVHVPTLVIIGERDIPGFHAVADTLCDHIDGARRVELADAGHQSSMDVPDLFNEVVLDFLKEIAS